MLHILAQVTVALRANIIKCVVPSAACSDMEFTCWQRLHGAQVASVGEVQARHLLEALAEDRRTARSPDSRQYRSVLSLVNVPGWGDRTVLNMIAANWVFQPYTSGVPHHTRTPRIPLGTSTQIRCKSCFI